MAELHVQEKERSAWPWMLAAVLLLGLLLWYFLGRDERVNVGAANSADTAAVGTAADGAMSGTAAGTLGSDAIAQYQEYLAANRSADAAGRSHDYTADGLRRLAAALSEVAAGNSTSGVDLQARIDGIRQRADTIQANPTSRDHALHTREAFNLAAGVVAQLRGNVQNPAAGTTVAGDSATRGGADILLDAANAIDPSRPLLDQTDRVEQFFTQAADALQRMSPTRR